MSDGETDVTEPEGGDDVAHWTAKEIELREQLADAERRLHDARCAASGYAIGDTVEWTNRGVTRRGVVADVLFWSDDTDPWRLSVHPLKKDGTPSANTVSVYLGTDRVRRVAS